MCCLIYLYFIVCLISFFCSGGSTGAPPVASNVMEALATIPVTCENIATLESDCAVCKDSFQLDETYHLLPCKHYFHCDCIKPWLDMVSENHLFLLICGWVVVWGGVLIQFLYFWY